MFTMVSRNMADSSPRLLNRRSLITGSTALISVTAKSDMQTRNSAVQTTETVSNPWEGDDSRT